MSSSTHPQDLQVRLGHDELVLRQRYEVLSIVNDVLVAAWFIAGSVLFFWESTSTVGTWFFLVGSVELMIRPVIRLTRKVHLRRRHGSPLDSGAEY
ncbi:YrhK family protein [Pseudokineococcus basanitobsidens]|uniref:YrhK family protein n=1 Tax=Pseudokineococcus basanitobsidens TaxID=1926649 RepID=A0ABU8RHQ6_9ACTN